MDYRKIIIVGETNIGRSFMAECILRGILQKRNCQNIEVVSRGLVVLFSEPVAPGAAKILREKGYRIEDFRSSQLTDEDLASADLVLAITKGLAEQIKESFDEATSCMSIGTFIDTTETEERIPEVTEEKDEELKKTVRIFPHKMKGEGHYVALLQKGEPLPAKELKTKKKAGKIPADLEEFMKQVAWKLDGSRLDIHGERIYYMPEGLPDVRGIRFLRTGLLLGELKKNRFEPSQAFAMCLKKDEYAQIIDLPCEDERVRRYLKGETLDVDDLTERKAKGWYLVCVDGFPLGWGKVSNGTLKNKYLPGWRLC